MEKEREKVGEREQRKKKSVGEMKYSKEDKEQKRKGK